MKIPIVDENDVQIGVKEREELLPEDIYRVSALWLTDTNGRHLMAQRALSKKKNPGKWGPAVAGTVEDGESYESNILKEISEEIGITLSIRELRIGPKIFSQKPTHRYFTQWYFASVDKDLADFTYPEEEVMDIRWVTTEEIHTALKEHYEDFIPSTLHWIELVLDGA